MLREEVNLFVMVSMVDFVHSTTKVKNDVTKHLSLLIEINKAGA